MKKKTFEEKKRIVLDFIEEIEVIKIQENDKIEITNVFSLLNYILKHIVLIWKKNNNIINLLKEVFSKEELYKAGILTEGEHKIHDKVVYCFGNTSIEAKGRSKITAFEKSFVRTENNCTVFAYDKTTVFAGGETLIHARDNSNIKCWDYSICNAYNNSKVSMLYKAETTGYDNSFIRAGDRSIVYANNKCKVVAFGYAMVYASERSIVDLFHYARAKVKGNVIITANDSSIIYEDEMISSFKLNNSAVLFRYNEIHTNKKVRIYKEYDDEEFNSEKIKINLKK